MKTEVVEVFVFLPYSEYKNLKNGSKNVTPDPSLISTKRNKLILKDRDGESSNETNPDGINIR